MAEKEKKIQETLETVNGLAPEKQEVILAYAQGLIAGAKAKTSEED